MKSDFDRRAPSVLHVINGDAMREALGRSGLAGEIATYADVLHEGPVPPGFGAEAAAVRARFLADAGYAPYDDALALNLHWQAALDRHADYDEVVLWLEHDLFDQLLLLHHLAFFDEVRRTRGVFLICTDEYLGPLGAAELARKHAARTKVGDHERALGTRAWHAFTGPDPMALQRIVDEDTGALPFLRGALIRLLEENPAVRGGLGRTDTQLLELLAERAHTPVDLFTASAQREERIFLADLAFWKHVEALARARVPLLEIETRAEFDDRLPDGMLCITDAGRDVVAGRRDAIELNGVDRWLGGVHLRDAAPWRWDRERGRLVPAPGRDAV